MAVFDKSGPSAGKGKEKGEKGAGGKSKENIKGLLAAKGQGKFGKDGKEVGGKDGEGDGQEGAEGPGGSPSSRRRGNKKFA